MRTAKLEAILESEIRVLKINRSITGDTVTLEVDGQVMTLAAGTRTLNTLHGRYRREDEAECQSL